MPCSEKRLAANRRNAQRSTGPRTVEGKRASSQNAFKHGLRSRDFDPSQYFDQDEFTRMSAAFWNESPPKSEEEFVLIGALAAKMAMAKAMAALDEELFQGYFIEKNGTGEHALMKASSLNAKLHGDAIRLMRELHELRLANQQTHQNRT